MGSFNEAAIDDRGMNTQILCAVSDGNKASTEPPEIDSTRVLYICTNIDALLQKRSLDSLFLLPHTVVGLQARFSRL
jgi:hypothetical protein